MFEYYVVGFGGNGHVSFVIRTDEPNINKRVLGEAQRQLALEYGCNNCANVINIIPLSKS